MPSRRQRATLLPATVLIATAVAVVMLLRRSPSPDLPSEETSDPTMIPSAPLALTVPGLSSIQMIRRMSQTVQEEFPGALPGPQLFSKVVRQLKEYGVVPGKTIYGQSVCSDEINGDKGHITRLLTAHFGHVFPMGGIGGAPYVGKTGFGAFSAHAPDKGNVVVLFAPHVGFTPDGECGKFLRKGQAAASTACGAAIAAYSQCTSGKVISADASDLEQSWIRQKLAPLCEKVTKSDSKMAELAMQMYKAIEAEVMSIVHTGFGPGNLVLIGGIQINMPYPMNGHFLPLHFSVRSSTMKPLDLMPALATPQSM